MRSDAVVPTTVAEESSEVTSESTIEIHGHSGVGTRPLDIHTERNGNDIQLVSFHSRLIKVF